MARKEEDVLPTFRFTDLTPLTDPYDKYQLYSPEVNFSSHTPRTSLPETVTWDPPLRSYQVPLNNRYRVGIALLPKWRQYFPYWILLLLTTLWLLHTIVLSFLSSSPYPPSFLEGKCIA
jgi:hypothetical protein